MKNKLKLSSILLALVALSGCAIGGLGILTATTAVVRNVAKDETVGETIDNKVISGKIAKAFFKGGLKDTYAKINVEVSQGRVMYIGKVKSEYELLKAVEIAWEIPGVIEVINKLELDSGQQGFDAGQYAKDTVITTQILLQAAARKGIKSVNFNVVTSNNIVYLFGKARTREELETMADIAAKVLGVERVVAKYVKVM